jgi:hypothetical protein
VGKVHTAEVTRRWLLSLGVILILSLASFLTGKFLYEYRSNKLDYKLEAESLSNEVQELQVKLGYMKPTEECVISSMKDWKPSGNFRSRKDARQRAYDFCSQPMYMSSEYVMNETPKHHQELWFRYRDAWERSRTPPWIEKIMPYKYDLRKFAMFGMIISLLLFGLTIFIRWLIVGDLRFWRKEN